jgi:hypothetical protein
MKKYRMYANRWRYFDTLEDAMRAAGEIHQRTGVVVGIEKAPERRKRSTRARRSR